MPAASPRRRLAVNDANGMKSGFCALGMRVLIAADMSISEDQVRRVATLARLKLDAAETTRLAADLSAILDYVDKLSELDTSAVEPTSHVVAVEAPFRDDTRGDRGPEQSAEEAVANAPRRDGHFFAVPPIIE
jgi:aspartyl-tRNA(Asn)/glutamyl-tRNA(Gln) amidotransferase subunit C